MSGEIMSNRLAWSLMERSSFLLRFGSQRLVVSSACVFASWMSVVSAAAYGRLTVRDDSRR